MKKFIALTIGLSLLASGMIISMSDASRDSYHAFLYKKSQQTKRYKRFSDRKINQKQILFPKTTSVRRSLNSYQRKNYLFPENKRNLFNASEKNNNLKQRTSTNRVIGMKMGLANNSVRVSMTTSGNADVTDFSFVNHSNELFSVEIPANSITNDSTEMLEADLAMSSAKIMVKKLDIVCHNSSFEICAKNISKMEDRSNDIYRNSQTVSSYLKNSDSILGSIELGKKKHMEGFVGVNKGNNTFIARFFVEGKNGDIFMLELTSNMNEIDSSSIIAKRLFETFRAKY